MSTSRRACCVRASVAGRDSTGTHAHALVHAHVNVRKAEDMGPGRYRLATAWLVA
jgi:hypothetical protein